MANQHDIADTIKAIQADVTTIVRGEIELAKAELIPQAKSVGIGAGLFGGAGYFAISAAGLLFLGAGLLVGHFFATGLGWSPLLAAFMGLTIVAVLLLILAGILALIGKGKVAAAKGPQATVAHAERSVEAVKGALQQGVADAEAEVESRKAARKAPRLEAGTTTGPDFTSPGA